MHFGRATPSRRASAFADVAFALVLMPLVLVLPSPDGTRLIVTSPPAVLLTAGACVALIGRRRAPVWTFGVVVVLVVPVAILTSTQSLAVVPLLVSMYSVAARRGRWAAGIVWGIGAGALICTLPFSAYERSLPSGVPFVLAWTALAIAIGDSVRHRQAYITSVEERAARAEQALEEETRRRVAEERLRIARELHDVVGHHMAVVTVQAGVASQLIDSDRRSAVEALALIRSAGRSVLEELAGMLSVLRDPTEHPSTAPVPGLADLEELLVSVKAAGLEINVVSTGTPRPVRAAVDLVAYRLLQEALTNAHKHGAGTATVVVGYTQEALTLRVTNPIGRAGGSGGGHGLTGMRERAKAVGGEVFLGTDLANNFEMRATLPTPVEPE